jgi:hypothetical protein
MIVAIVYVPVFFRGMSRFKDDMANSTKEPLLNKDYDPVETAWSKDKMLLWIILSLGSGFLAYYQLPVWFPKVFGK